MIQSFKLFHKTESTWFRVNPVHHIAYYELAMHLSINFSALDRGQPFESIINSYTVLYTVLFIAFG